MGNNSKRSSRKAIWNAFLLVSIAFGMVATKNAIAQMKSKNLRSPAKVFEFHCKENDHSRKEWDYNAEIQLTLGASKLEYLVVSHDIRVKNINGIGEREFDFDNIRQYLYTDPTGQISSSDTVGNIFLDQAMLKGQPGHMVLTSSTVIDEDGKTSLEWSTVAELNCQ